MSLDEDVTETVISIGEVNANSRNKNISKGVMAFRMVASILARVMFLTINQLCACRLSKNSAKPRSSVL